MAGPVRIAILANGAQAKREIASVNRTLGRLGRSSLGKTAAALGIGSLVAGVVRFDGQPVLEADVRSMCRVMVHRGPDEEGVFLAPGVGMGKKPPRYLKVES